MLAVGASMEEALELCEDPDFDGRLALAANNSSSSVTISGDSEAISQLQLVLDDEKKFNRLLKVDTYADVARSMPSSQPSNIRMLSTGNTTPSNLTDTLYCTIDTSRIDDEQRDGITAGAIRTVVGFINLRHMSAVLG
jgi:hypothetical protein